MRTFTSLLITLILSVSGFSQAQLVFDGNIGMSFANGTQANPVYLVIDNQNANAIVDVAPVGGPAILSESEYHIVKWNVKSSASGTYNVPFISLTGGLPEYVSPSVTLTGAGTETTVGSGSIEFSTYNHNNALATTPSDVNHMNYAISGATGGESDAIDRFWIMDATGFAARPDVAVAFVYDDDELEATMVEPDLLIQRYNSDTDNWLDYNMLGHPVNGAVNIAGAAPVPSGQFYRSWTITNATNPLPIHLLSFNSECKDRGTVELSWSTGAEINNSHFTLERSEDGIIWEAFADMILGAGNSSNQNDYRHTDNNPFRGLTYYRLTQTDFDGTSETFDPIVNDCDGVGFEIISAYSAEGSEAVQLVVSAARDESFLVEILDLSGKIVLGQSNVRMQEGLNYFNLDKTSLSTGIYVIKLQSENELMTRKVMLN